MKAVNPGGVTAWKWGKDAKALSEPVDGYSKVTPAKIISSLAQIVDELGLPHPLHLHCNNLGAPGNFATTLETMKVWRATGPTWPICSSTPTAATTGTRCAPRRPPIAEYFNAHPNLTTDAGAVLFGNTVTITADGPWQHLLYQLTGRKWGNLDVENETGCGIVPYTYKGSNLVNAVQWAVGLELLLLIDDPWRIFLTTDHPNGACFLALSGDHPPADERRVPPRARENTARESAEPHRARRSGSGVHALRDRHHHVGGSGSGAGAVAERAPGRRRRCGRGHLSTKSPMANSDVPLSALCHQGRRDRRRGRRDSQHESRAREFSSNPAYDGKIEDYLRPLFQQYYTMSFDNYPVEMERLERAEVRPCR